MALDDATTIELLEEAKTRIVARNQYEHIPRMGESVNRNLALAITHIEDAQMRYTRARAIEDDKFNPGDLDKNAN